MKIALNDGLQKVAYPSMARKKIVVSDAAPLIQLSLAHHLDLLPLLYEVAIPEKVFEETQYYRELSDAIEIAKVTAKWQP